jgi:hypothetical protein
MEYYRQYPAIKPEDFFLPYEYLNYKLYDKLINFSIGLLYTIRNNKLKAISQMSQKKIEKIIPVNPPTDFKHLTEEIEKITKDLLIIDDNDIVIGVVTLDENNEINFTYGGWVESRPIRQGVEQIVEVVDNQNNNIFQTRYTPPDTITVNLINTILPINYSTDVFYKLKILKKENNFIRGSFVKDPQGNLLGLTIKTDNNNFIGNTVNQNGLDYNLIFRIVGPQIKIAEGKTRMKDIILAQKEAFILQLNKLVSTVNFLYKWYVKFFNEESKFTFKSSQSLLDLSRSLNIPHDKLMKDYEEIKLKKKKINFKFNTSMSNQTLYFAGMELLKLGNELKEYIDKLSSFKHDHQH